MGHTESSVRPGKVVVGQDDSTAARFVACVPAGRPSIDVPCLTDPVVATQVRDSRRIVVVIPAQNEQDRLAGEPPDFPVQLFQQGEL